RPAGRGADRVVERLVAHAEAEGEASAAYFIQIAGSLAQLHGVAPVDVDDARAEAQRAGRVREGVGERHAGARLRAGYPVEATPLDLAGNLERVPIPPRHRDERERELDRLWHGWSPAGPSRPA